MPTVLVNDQPVEIGENERLNCIQAAAKAGYEVPAYCWHPALSVVASCRMCLVEVGEKKPDGTVQMMPKLVPGCQTPVKDGTVIISESEKVKTARKATLEYLLINHPLDCPTCDQAGECFLQDYSYRHGRGYSRLQEPKNIKPDKDHIGEQITLFTDRCIMCTRCVRFTREISGTAELQVIGRGSREEIDIFPGEPCNNKLAGNVVDLCPVGALCSKDFLYKQRVWWLNSTDSVCNGCSGNCTIHIDQNEDHVYRVRPRENPQENSYFMCDDGRFGWKYIHSEERLRFPESRDNGKVLSRDWDHVFAGVKTALEEAGARDSSRVAAVFSPYMTVEEAYLLAKEIQRAAPTATLALGPVPIIGEDDHYPKGVNGQPQEPIRFTISAEKCPNRHGIELLLAHYGDQATTFNDVIAGAKAGKFDFVYLVGGAPMGWITDDQATALSGVNTVVVQDLLPSPALAHAKFILAGGSFAERDGTYVNKKGLAQEIRKAILTPGNARPDGRILWELSGRRGLFNVKALRKEIAEAIPALSVLSEGTVGEFGKYLAEPAAVNG